MRWIIVAAKGAAPQSPVEPVIGRADWFLFFNAETGAFSHGLENPYRDQSRECGTMVAQMLVDEGAGAVLGGNVGPRAALVLRDAGVSVAYPFSGSAEESIKNFLDARQQMQRQNPVPEQS